jgi:hypothetical protein
MIHQERPKKRYCCTCAKQLVSYRVGQNNPTLTIAQGAKAGFSYYLPFCGYCAKELDEYGLFPEERATVPELNF